MRNPIGEAIFSAEEFERESKRIEELIWDAIAVEPGEEVLFCGFGNGDAAIDRAVAAGARVSVLESREERINEKRRDLRVLRGSTSVIPARENAYDVAIAFHYLHEVDPFFHAQIISELARVAHRVVIVEPAPPADPLGQRIAMLYSRAKRELGAFEYYQPLDYWRKLLSIVKADISQAIFAFSKVPPREYLFDTIELVLHTMEVEEVPPAYLEELRKLADRPDAQLLPPARLVLVGAASGELPKRAMMQSPMDREIAGLDAPSAPHPIAVSPPPSQEAPTFAGPTPAQFGPMAAPPPGWNAPGSPVPHFPQAGVQPPTPAPPAAFSDEEDAYVFAADPPGGSSPFGIIPGAPAPTPGAPFGMPFAVGPEPQDAQARPPDASGWKWEPPDEPEPPESSEQAPPFGVTLPNPPHTP